MKTLKYTHCPICNFPSHRVQGDRESLITCFRCGLFVLTHGAEALLRHKLQSRDQRLNASSYISSNQRITLTQSLLSEISEIKQPSVQEKSDRLLRHLRHLSKAHPTPGTRIYIPFTEILESLNFLESDGTNLEELDEEAKAIYISRDYLPIMAACWAKGKDEFAFLLSDSLVERELLAYPTQNYYMITAKGWELLDRPIGNPESTQAFIAMSFDRSLDHIYDSLIFRAVEKCGFDPVRLDKTEHINRIDDEIIARIRGSRFLIADFTQHKNGVYFEAGFALGLGIPVIWMCQKDDLANSHFDTRQYNAVTWEEDDIEDARARLEIRITAVVGSPNRCRSLEPISQVSQYPNQWNAQ